MSEKWWDISDDELDDLFREASDKAQIPFDSSALDKLRQKINFKPSPEPQQGFKKRWLVLLSLLFFVGMIFLYTFHSKRDISNQPTTPKITERLDKKEVKKDITLPSSTTKNIAINKLPIPSEITHNQPFNDKKLKEINDKMSFVPTREVSVKEGEKVIEKTSANAEVMSSEFNNFPKKLVNGNAENITNQTPISISTNSDGEVKTVENGLIIYSYEKVNPANSSGVFMKSTVVGENVKFTSETEKSSNKQRKPKSKNSMSSPEIVDYQNNTVIVMPIIPTEERPIEQGAVQKTNFYILNFLSNKGTKPLETNIEPESPTYAESLPIAMKQPLFSRFGIRVAIAPEINSIERMETSAVVGSSYGLFLEYRITKKLTVQTGVNYSSKKYTGDFEYYHAWTNAPSPQPLNVEGLCKVIDIPVNLRLNVFQKPQNTLFISGGVSSYLMSDEIYTYNYAWGVPKVRNWTGSSSSFYWSTINLSAGIERKMTKHLTLQVEPFLKTPIKGVGRGLINLYTSGILFSTKYEF